MAGKRRTRAAKPKGEDLAMPSKWRLQHGPVGEPMREADPETGLPVVHRRTVDTLGQMLANGTITQEMHDAGAVFRRQFRVAALDQLRAMPLIRHSWRFWRFPHRSPGRSTRAGRACHGGAGRLRERSWLLRLARRRARMLRA